jgi:hypothetical protein
MQINLAGVFANGALPAGGGASALPTEQDVSWPRGEDGTIVVTVKDGAGVAVNLTGGTIFLGVRRYGFDAGALLKKTAVLTNAAGGVATVTLAAGDTAALAAEKLRYDVWYTAASGLRYQLVRSSVFSLLEADTLPSDP